MSKQEHKVENRAVLVSSLFFVAQGVQQQHSFVDQARVSNTGKDAMHAEAMRCAHGDLLNIA